MLSSYETNVKTDSSPCERPFWRFYPRKLNRLASLAGAKKAVRAASRETCRVIVTSTSYILWLIIAFMLD